MGILNVTPDSFSDGGRLASPDAAVSQAMQMLDEGADLIDIGGESTRPGATGVPEREELDRVLPVVERLAAQRPDAVISVDTMKSGVARAALQAGAHVVNDVSGLRLDPSIAAVCAEWQAGLVIMHSRGLAADLATFSHARYEDVEGEVLQELQTQVNVAREAGVAANAIAVDPGIGFAKRGEHSLAALKAIPRIAAWHRSVLVGVSRKRVIGEITGNSHPEDRLYGTVGANVAALALGARIFRVHDVRPNRDALDVAWAILGPRR